MSECRKQVEKIQPCVQEKADIEDGWINRYIV